MSEKQKDLLKSIILAFLLGGFFFWVSNLQVRIPLSIFLALGISSVFSIRYALREGEGRKMFLIQSLGYPISFIFLSLIAHLHWLQPWGTFRGDIVNIVIYTIIGFALFGGTFLLYEFVFSATHIEEEIRRTK